MPNKLRGGWNTVGEWVKTQRAQSYGVPYYSRGWFDLSVISADET